MPLHSSVLRYFDTVARYGSIRRAAGKLNVSSSSVNRQILSLEQEFGVDLLERVAKGVRLTAAGQVLLDHVRRTLRDFEHAHADIQSLRGLHSGRIPIATVASVGTSLLSSVLAEFRTSFPGIDFDISSTNSAGVVDLLAQDAVDLGFSFDPGGRSHLRELFSIELPLGAIMSLQHPLAAKENLSLADCLDHDIILPSPTLSIRDIIDGFLARRSKRPRICIEVDSLSISKSLVVQGAGIAFQTVIGLEPELSQNRLAFKPLQDEHLPCDRFVVVASNSRVLPLASRVFAERCCQSLDAYFTPSE